MEDTLAEIAKFEPEDVQGYQELLKHSEKLFDAGFTNLADQPFHSLPLMLKQIPRLAHLRTDRTVWQLVTTYLKHPKIREAFSIQPLLVGGSPFDTTSIYGLIHYLERKWGVFFAMGGTGAIVSGLGRLMEEEGIKIRLGTTVRELIIDGRKATGAILETGERLTSDIVVSNTDPMHLYRNMVPEKKLATSTAAKKNSRLSMGLFVLYFGTSEQYPDVAHHTIWLGTRYKDLLDDIFKHKRLAEDFSLYLHRPTATDPSFAPEGCDSYYVLCPVPNLNADLDWSVEGPKLRDRIVAALGRTVLPGLRDTIRSDFYMTPEDFEHDYLSYKGAGFRSRHISPSRHGSASTTSRSRWTTCILQAPGPILVRECPG